MRRSLGGITITPSRVLLLCAVLVAGAAAIHWRGQLDLATLHVRTARLSSGVVLAGLALLPLVGFPATVAHVVAGAKFGLLPGLTLVGLSIAFQLAASQLLVQAAPGFFARRFSSLRQKLPPATHRSLALFILLLPGAPYFAQNYLLVLSGVGFRIFFGYGLAVHLVRSTAGVVFGGWSGHLTPGRLLLVVLYNIVIITACGLAFRRLRARWCSRPPGADDRKPGA